MPDAEDGRPDHGCLFDIASEQHGYFTVDQARACGFSWRTMLYHTKRGRFLHVRRGLYRLRAYPASPREEVAAAWLAVGKHDSAVSHETALDLLDLSDVTPSSIHLSVPRARRGLNPPPGVTIHTLRRRLQPDEVTIVDGIRVTAAPRTIVDAAEAGTGPEQIEMAVAQALRLGLATPEELRAQASTRRPRVEHLIAQAITRARHAAESASTGIPA